MLCSKWVNANSGGDSAKFGIASLFPPPPWNLVPASDLFGDNSAWNKTEKCVQKPNSNNNKKPQITDSITSAAPLPIRLLGTALSLWRPTLVSLAVLLAFFGRGARGRSLGGACPNANQRNKTAQPKAGKYILDLIFCRLNAIFQRCFVAWKRGSPRKFASCVPKAGKYILDLIFRQLNTIFQRCFVARKRGSPQKFASCSKKQISIS